MYNKPHNHVYCWYCHPPSGAATPDLASSQLLSELLVVAAANDYYALLGVGGGAPAEEVAKARRERSKQLHPDHFTSDPDKREL